MIRKARIKFIDSIMLILLAVFIIIFGVVAHFMSSSTYNAIYKVLGDIKQTYTENLCDYPQANSFYAKINGDKNSELNLISIEFDQNVFSLNEVKGYLQVIRQNNLEKNKLENIFFISQNVGENKIIVGLDATFFLNEFSNNLINLIIFSVVALIVLFFIVLLVSYKVLEPCKEALYKQKTFISNASHELKTPLAIINANAFILQNQNDNQYVQNIKNQSERMDDLVKDMLSLAKIDEGINPLNVEEINLSNEICAIALPLEEVAFEKGKMLNLSIPNDVIIKADRQSVRRVISILIENAVKYGEKGGSINISLKKENRVVFSVYNDGNLVPEQDKEKIFERFYRSDEARSREKGGSGLGLAIAKSLCTLNKWKIYATPIKNKSMTMTVIF